MKLCTIRGTFLGQSLFVCRGFYVSNLSLMIKSKISNVFNIFLFDIKYSQIFAEDFKKPPALKYALSSVNR